MEQNALFRKSALDKLASPERLDVLMQVTSPVGWLALTTIGAVLTAVVVWSFLDRIPERVDGQGILIRGGGLREVRAGGEGVLTKLSIRLNENVKVNQLIGEIELPSADENIKMAQTKLAEAQSEAVMGSASDQVVIVQTRGQIEVNETEIVSLQQQIEAHQVDIASKKELLDKGVITKARIQQIESQITSLRGRVNGLRGTNNSLRSTIAQIQAKMRAGGSKVNIAQAEVARLRSTKTTATQVRCSVQGRVIELKKSMGDRVRVGEVLALVEEVVGDLAPIVYVSSREGKRIKPGMLVQVSPSTVRREEWGFIRGTVVSVSEYPVTQEAMMATVANAALVTTLMGKDPPLEVRVSLATDPGTVSGFQWSSSTGPPHKIDGGTRLTGSFLVDERAPITLVLPMVKGALGIS
jgi:HlyD family secretion protein